MSRLSETAGKGKVRVDSTGSTIATWAGVKPSRGERELRTPSRIGSWCLDIVTWVLDHVVLNDRVWLYAILLVIGYYIFTLLPWDFGCAGSEAVCLYGTAP